MPAPRALAFTYWMLTRHLDEDALLEVEAILGNEEARAVKAERNREAINVAGWEVG